MLGAIIGDVVGSIYEFESHKSKRFPLFVQGCRPTDDSVMTVAVGCACVEADLDDEVSFKTTLAEKMRELGRLYPNAGYGEHFYDWLMDDRATAYGSYANGAAMRVSPVAWVAESLEEAERLAKWSAEITHDHPYAIRSAQAVAGSIYLARMGADKTEIRAYVERNYYDLNYTVEQIRPTYCATLTAEGSVPQAIVCFLDAVDYEDAIRNAISLGGDADTMGAIAGSIAWTFYRFCKDGLSEHMLQLQKQADEHLPDDLIRLIDEFDRLCWDTFPNMD